MITIEFRFRDVASSALRALFQRRHHAKRSQSCVPYPFPFVDCSVEALISTRNPVLKQSAAASKSRGIQRAERLVERREIFEFWMICIDRDYVFLIAEHIVDKALQCLLGPDFDEYASAGGRG